MLGAFGLLWAVFVPGKRRDRRLAGDDAFDYCGMHTDSFRTVFPEKEDLEHLEEKTRQEALDFIRIGRYACQPVYLFFGGAVFQCGDSDGFAVAFFGHDIGYYLPAGKAAAAQTGNGGDALCIAWRFPIEYAREYPHHDADGACADIWAGFCGWCGGLYHPFRQPALGIWRVRNRRLCHACGGRRDAGGCPAVAF